MWYYRSSSAFAPSFAVPSNSTGGSDPGGLVIIGSRPNMEITQWKDWQKQVGNYENKVSGLGGWSLGIHHVYDPSTKTLFRGDGSKVFAETVSTVVKTVAGTGVAGYSGDNGSAKNAQIRYPEGIAVSSTGAIYFTDGNVTYPSNMAGRVRRIGTDGVITTVAGTGVKGFSGDGGSALLANINARRIALGPDDTLYISDTGNNRIRRVGANGIITTIAGNGTSGSSGDGGLRPVQV